MIDIMAIIPIMDIMAIMAIIGIMTIMAIISIMDKLAIYPIPGRQGLFYGFFTYSKAGILTAINSVNVPL
jgi:hypothetical protein